MEVAAKRRLPGVYFQVEVPQSREVLPRMDVAGFVGFAAKGALHMPVPIEDVERFRDLFGAPHPLAWNSMKGDVETTYLAPAVEAFFRNGGRRCWVVRVAGTGATTNEFPLVNVIDAGTGRPALARARSAGSWSDALRVSTVLNRRVFGEALDISFDGAYAITLAAYDDQVKPGDLLRLTFDSGNELYLTVKERTLGSSSALQIIGEEARWFARRIETSASSLTATSTLIDPGGDTVLPECALTMPTASADWYEAVFSADGMPAIEPGDVLHLTVSTGSPPAMRTVWLSVSDVTRTEEGDIRVGAEDGLWPLALTSDEEDTLLNVETSPPSLPAVERVSFDLLVWDGEEVQYRLTDLGLSGARDTVSSRQEDRMRERRRRGRSEPVFRDEGTRFWGRLPVDDVLLQPVEGSVTAPDPASLEADAYDPRFPLAGPLPYADVYVPLGMPAQADADRAQGRVVASDRTPLERDGLESFSASLFLDSDLKQSRLTTLRSQSNQKLYVQKEHVDGRSFEGVPLGGLHALWPLQEVTLLAVPDAAHRGWSLQPPPMPAFLEAPQAFSAEFEPPDQVVLTWNAVSFPDPAAEAVTYEVQEAQEPLFEQPEVRYRGADAAAVVYVAPTTSSGFFYRVRATSNGLAGPWSTTQYIVVPPAHFTSCRPPLEAPVLTAELPPVAKLFWDCEDREDAGAVGSPVEDDLTYILQESGEPTFAAARTIPSEMIVWDPERSCYSYAFDVGRKGVYYYRLRIEQEAKTSPWSNTARVVLEPSSEWSVTTPADFDAPDAAARGVLRDVHRAMLRMSAARGDVLSILSLPNHYREDGALAHVAALTPDTRDDAEADPSITPTGVPRLGFGEGEVLSFGALYHPWVGERVERQDKPVTFTPPDGAISGVVAARALSEGAWIAPANIPLQQVLAVNPAVSQAGRQRLLDRQINVVTPDPRGFLVMSADTLSASEDLRPVNVRRLLILLRRLALRAGTAYVFESNNADLRRRIYYRFVSLMGDLYQRGALAGSTPETAYQVVTGSSINTPQRIEQGRLIVELKVAPSRPMAFITVRLVQRDLEGLVLEEA